MLQNKKNKITTDVINWMPGVKSEQNKKDNIHNISLNLIDGFLIMDFERELTDREIIELASERLQHQNKEISKTLALEYLHRGNKLEMDERQISETIIGSAVALVMFALIFLARRKQEIPVPGGKFIRNSKDFIALQEIKNGTGDAARIANNIINTEINPWDFQLEPAIKKITSFDDQRTILLALVGHDVGFKKIAPTRGDRFEPMRMKSTNFIQNETEWVVTAPPNEHSIGFLYNENTFLYAEVNICTADWWILALSDEECPIAKCIKEDPERYLGLEANYAIFWEVRNGFNTFADLRDRFEETKIHEWSKKLEKRIEKYYPAPSNRRLINIGEIGEKYDPSVMRSIDPAPNADAIVTAIEKRDGHLQRGLGCEGAPPLLYAIVRIQEE